MPSAARTGSSSAAMTAASSSPSSPHSSRAADSVTSSRGPTCAISSVSSRAGPSIVYSISLPSPGAKRMSATACSRSSTRTRSESSRSTLATDPHPFATSGCTVDAYESDGVTTYATTSNSVGAVADGQVGLSYYWNSTTNYGYSGNWVGSSFSATNGGWRGWAAPKRVVPTWRNHVYELHGDV
jgi:hypothetical protein